jgi:hypothetical protein
MYQSFLSYKRKRYLWVAVALCVASLVHGGDLALREWRHVLG